MMIVTTVTCARNIYGKFTSFYINTGGFTAERVTRASDNGDRRLSKQNFCRRPPYTNPVSRKAKCLPRTSVGLGEPTYLRR